MTPTATLYLFFGLIFLLAVEALLLIALQANTFDAYKRRIAVSAIGLYLVTAAGIWFNEDIKAFLWDEPPLAQWARAATKQAASAALSAEDGEEGAGGGGRATLAAAQGGAAGGGADAVEAVFGPGGGDPKARIRRNLFQECPDCPQMVIIPAGDDGQSIATFAIGRFELTVQELHTFAVQSGTSMSSACDGQGRAPVGRLAVAPAYLGHGLQHATGRPAACLSWREAQAYLTWLSAKTGHRYRLPTVREWTHAAGGNEQHSITPATAVIQRVGLTLPDAARLSIGAAPANGFGVFDMAGNVAEWVFGCAPLTSDVGVAADLSRGCARLALGGSAATGDSLTWTQSAGPSHASASIGVRVARDLPAN